MPATFSVTSVADAGLGSLRQAILDSNTAGGSNSIAFSIPDNSSNPETYVIGLTSGPLPAITDQLALNGATESAFLGKAAVVEINGSGITGTPNGLNLSTGSSGSDLSGLEVLNFGGFGILVQSANNTIGGTVAGSGDLISGNTTYGVQITGSAATGNAVEGNQIGTDVTGAVAIANGTGVEINNGAAGNTIGGLTATPGTGAGNLISGNTGAGITISDTGTSGNTVEGDLIGTKAGGTSPLANGTDGVVVQTNAAANTIGGTAAGARNVISGNAVTGVYIANTSAANYVQGNDIGTDVTGTASVPNLGGGAGGAGGVFIGFANNQVIGGTTAAARNVISGNTGQGLVTSAITSVTLEGNDIGTNAAGTGLLGNSQNGIETEGGTTGITIGGTAAGAGNVISGNNNGIFLPDSGITVVGNYIGLNAAGTAAIGNNQAGILIAYGVSNDTIGGTAPGAGNVISGNTTGVAIGGGGGVQVVTGNLVIGNDIGTNAAGTAAIGNGTGVVIQVATGGGTTSGNTIGGTSAGAGNLISGNTTYGVQITGSGTTGNAVEGNQIGTDVTGTVAIANGTGVEIDTSATGNTIGGLTSTPGAGAGNVISGNSNYGVWVVAATSNVIEGNLIGTDATGTVAVANGLYGVEADTGANYTTVGGTVAGAGNVISGNTSYGVIINSSGSLVAGNLIGLNRAGTTAVANLSSGIRLAGANNTVGGITAAARNVVSGNTHNGIFVTGVGATGNLIEGNYVGTNAVGGAAVPNSSASAGSYRAILINSGAQNTTVGGSTAGAGNLLSGNLGWGLEVDGPVTANTVIEGNLIGTDATGTFAIGNGQSGGIVIYRAINTTIGGTTVAARNVVSGNQSAGIIAQGTGLSQLLIEGNYIGTNSAGTAGISNFEPGVYVEDLAANVTIGSAVAGGGNLISGNAYGGIYVTNQDGVGVATNVVIQNNSIGTNAAGTGAIPNFAGAVGGTGAYAGSGVIIYNVPNVVVGGSSANTRNLISGNAAFGVAISGAASTGNQVLGNFIGTDVTGTVPLGNATGVITQSGATSNTIGGTSAGAGNLISGNTTYGVQITGSGTTDNVVEGNQIGTDVTGAVAIANGTGIELNAGASGNTIGGLTATPGTGAGNLISGNTGAGITISDTGTSGNAVKGNLIGTKAGGTSPLANGTDGVLVENNASANTIGGTSGGAGNVLSGNSGDGVAIVVATSNLVAGNWIGTNALGTAALGNTGDGVYLNLATANTIGGTSPASANLISRNSNGVEINDASLNLVQGNLIGTDSTGTLRMGNTGAGVLVDAGSAASTVGGPVGGARNLISGNAEGVVVAGAATTGTVVAGNLIGTDINGTSNVGNLSAGVSVSGASGTTIGGTTILARNIISANAGDGVDITGGATNTLIQGNDIGLDQTGTQPLGNTGTGVSVNGAPGTTIGGTAQAAGNVISANVQAGVSIQGSASTGIAILGNFIGTDDTGTSALGNGTFGVVVGDPPGITIGGTGAGARNIISGNTGAGVALVADATGELVEGNLIGTDVTGSNPLGNGTGVLIDGGSSNNTIGGTAAAPAIPSPSVRASAWMSTPRPAPVMTSGSTRSSPTAALGIDLGGDGVTSNNSVPHIGPNDHQNFPVITAVTISGGTTTVSGTLEQHAKHDVRARLLHALVDECLGLWRGAVRRRLGAAGDRRFG